MQKTLNSLEAEYATIRAGRANPNVLNKLTVDYYGVPTPIQQAANISVPEARMIQIQPWDKSLIKEIEKAIQPIAHHHLSPPKRLLSNIIPKPATQSIATIISPKVTFLANSTLILVLLGIYLITNQPLLVCYFIILNLNILQYHHL